MGIGEQDLVKKIEGIFEVEHPEDDYAKIKTKSTKAKILKIEHESKNISSTAFLADNTKNFDGASITLENSLGKEEVFFPGITSTIDYKNLEGVEVDYFEKKWSSKMEGTSVDYVLKVLSGPWKGRTIKGNTFA